MKKNPSLTLQSTAYHEAGHHAMKWEFGFSLGKVTIKPDLENHLLGSSGHHHPPLRIETIKRLWEVDVPTPRQVQRIENMIMVCLAGREAERIFRPNRVIMTKPGNYSNFWWITPAVNTRFTGIFSS